MAAIRAVNPAAELLQTEDLGKTFSTAAACATRPSMRMSGAG